MAIPAILTEDHLIPLDRCNLAIESRDRASAEKSSRGQRWLKDRLLHILLADHAVHSPFPDELVRAGVVEAHVVILQVDRLQPRIAPGESFRLAHRLEQKFLRHP